MCHWAERIDLHDSIDPERRCLACESYEMHGYGDGGLCYSPDVATDHAVKVRENQVCIHFGPRWALGALIRQMARTVFP